MHMLGHHDVGKHVEVLPLPGRVEGIEEEVGTGGLEEDGRAAIGRECERVGMPLLVDTNPPHIWIMMGGVVITASGLARRACYDKVRWAMIVTQTLAHREEHPGHASGLPFELFL